jgi:RimJ/RimL family protein N-acetyltransferase
LWRLHVEIEDRPGRLGALAAAVGAAGCNIVSLTVLSERGPDGSVTDELLVEAADEDAATELANQIRSAGMGCTLAVPAGGDELRDPVTTSLALARRVVGDPEAAPRAMASLLHARLLTDDDRSSHSYRMTVLDHDIRLGRAWPFTATELSRAAVLAELAELCAPRQHSRTSPERPDSLGLVLLGNGSEVELRLVRPSDGPLVGALHARCTPNTRRSAFLHPSPSLPAHELTGLIHGESGKGVGVLALTTDGGHAVGISTLDPDDSGGAKLGVLVEDTWQARGVGTALIRRVVEIAAERSFVELTASAHPGNLRITRLLRRAGLRPTAQLLDGLLRVRVQLPEPSGQ